MRQFNIALYARFVVKKKKGKKAELNKRMKKKRALIETLGNDRYDKIKGERERRFLISEKWRGGRA